MAADAKIWFENGLWNGIIGHGRDVVISNMQIEELIEVLKKQNGGHEFYWYPRLYSGSKIGLVGFVSPRKRWDG